jgi:hypothetical protein
MGLYDSVYFICLKCNTKIIKQSKAGLCHLKTYKSNLTPANIAMDIINNIVTCDKCKSIFKIVGEVPRIHLSLNEKNFQEEVDEEFE